MTVIRPQESVVGVMLYWDKVAKLVAADGIGIAQHNVLLWQVDLETCLLYTSIINNSTFVSDYHSKNTGIYAPENSDNSVSFSNNTTNNNNDKDKDTKESKDGKASSCLLYTSRCV